MPAIVLPPDASSDMVALAARIAKLESQPLGNPMGALVPGFITTLTLTTAPERDPKTGNDVATITATWTAPADAQPVAYYNLRFSYDAGSTWSAIDQVYALTAVIHNLLLNKSVKVGVRAVSTSGVQGAETQNTITTQFDVTAPNTPSTPTGSAGALQFTAIWDGKDNAAASLLASAPDLASVQVHASQSTGFTPSAATLFGNITSLTGGSFTSLTTASGIWYIKFVAVDKTGNASAGSTQFQVTVLPAAVTSTAVGTIRNTDVTMFQTPTSPGGLGIGTPLAATVSDTGAFDGTAAGVGTTAATNWVAWSNYSGLKPGQYRATAYIKIASGAGSASQICVLDLLNTTNISCNPQTVTGAAFASNGSYYAITMPVFVTGACNAQVVVKQPNATTGNFNVSHITIDTSNDIPAEFIRALAVVDAKIANVSADKIVAGTITATVGIGTLGIVRAGTAGAARVDITSGGITGYNGANSPTFIVDSSNGNVTVTNGTITGGVIRTASSGVRWELSSSVGVDKLNGYTGATDETAPARILTAGFGGAPTVGTLTLTAPQMSAQLGYTQMDMNTNGSGGHGSIAFAVDSIANIWTLQSVGVTQAVPLTATDFKIGSASISRGILGLWRQSGALTTISATVTETAIASGVGTFVFVSGRRYAFTVFFQGTVTTAQGSPGRMLWNLRLGAGTAGTILGQYPQQLGSAAVIGTNFVSTGLAGTDFAAGSSSLSITGTFSGSNTYTPLAFSGTNAANAFILVEDIGT